MDTAKTQAVKAGDDKTAKADKAAADNTADLNKKAALDSAAADAKADLDSLLGPPDATRWVINLASGKAPKMPPDGSPATTLVIIRDFDAAKADSGYDDLDKDDPLKSNWDKRAASAAKADKAAKKTADDSTDGFRFLLRHAPASVSFIEVQCAASVEEAKNIVLSLLPACSLEQVIAIKPDAKPPVFEQTHVVIDADPTTMSKTTVGGKVVETLPEDPKAVKSPK